MPLYRKLPHRGFNNANFRTEIAVVNLRDLGRLGADVTEVDAALLAKAGLIRSGETSVKVLGDGEITRALKVTAARFSGLGQGQDREGRGQGDRRLRVTLRMFSAFANSLKIPELRSRIFYTLALLFVARVGAGDPAAGHRPAPAAGVLPGSSRAGRRRRGNRRPLQHVHRRRAPEGGRLLLGIMPYISASIIFQLMTAVVPTLSRLQQEGDVGRQKLTQYTRYATVLICVVQGTLTILALENPARLFPGYDVGQYGNIVIVSKLSFLVTSVIYLTAGTMLMMWLGEQITQRGIGNGVSLLITVGILATLPGAAAQTYQFFFGPVGTNAGHGLPLGAAHDPALLRGHDGDHPGGPGPEEDPRPVRKARRGQQGDGRPELLPAAQGQLLGRHARHLRERHPALPAADHVAAGRRVQPAVPDRVRPEPPARPLDLLHRATPFSSSSSAISGSRSCSSRSRSPTT